MGDPVNQGTVNRGFTVLPKGRISADPQLSPPSHAAGVEEKSFSHCSRANRSVISMVYGKKVSP